MCSKVYSTLLACLSVFLSAILEAAKERYQLLQSYEDIDLLRVVYGMKHKYKGPIC